MNVSTNSKKKTNKKSANALCEGIAFQYAAAILVLIKHMRDVKSIGVEDENDIRVVLKSNENIYAQAKSSLEPDRIQLESHLSSDIKSALESLYDNKDYGKKLITIFNYYNPFGENPKFGDTMEKSYHFNHLSTPLKEKLLDYCKKDLDVVQKLEFWFLKFEGQDPFVDLVEIVDQSLRKIDGRDFHSKEMVQEWRCMMEENAISKTEMIDIEYILGSLFDHVVKNGISFKDVLDIFDFDIDFCAIDTMTQYFNQHFRKSRTAFFEYNSILASFHEFRKNNPALRGRKNNQLISFAEAHCTRVDPNLLKMFEGEDNSSDLAMYYHKIFVVTCIMKHNVIEKIKEIFNYDN